MDNNASVQILLIFIPALLVLATAFLFLKKFLDDEGKARLFDLKKGIQKDTLPLRLQAYERSVLFLERISPQNLLKRAQRPGISARELQMDLLNIIRNEYDHNITQQIYVSSHSWEKLKSAREEMVKLINISLGSLPEGASGMDLSRKVLEHVTQTQDWPWEDAIELFKKEVRFLF